MTQDIPSTATFANAFVYNLTYQRRDTKDSKGYFKGFRIHRLWFWYQNIQISSERLAEQKAVIEHEKYGRKGESGKLVGS